MNSAALSSAAAAASSSSSSVAGSVVSHGSVAAVAVVSGASASPSAVANQGSTPAAAAAAAAVAAVAAATVLVSSNNSSSTGSKTLTATDSGNAAAAVKAKTSIGLHFVAGGIGGALGAIVTCPLEVWRSVETEGLTRVFCPGDQDTTAIVAVHQAGPNGVDRVYAERYPPLLKGSHCLTWCWLASSTFGISSRPSGISRLGNVVYGQFGAAIETMSDIYRTEGILLREVAIDSPVRGRCAGVMEGPGSQLGWHHPVTRDPLFDLQQVYVSYTSLSCDALRLKNKTKKKKNC